MLTEIGALVSIVKGVVDITKTGTGFFGRENKTAAAAADKLKARIAGIAEQLHQSVALSKMLPIWLKDYAEVDLWTSKLSTEEIKLLDSKLRNLIGDSIHDHFSGTFFRTSFECLPGVEGGIDSFRTQLLALETQLNGIPTGDAKIWGLSWPTLKVRMGDLRAEAVKINNLADELHSSLVKELREAGK